MVDFNLEGTMSKPPKELVALMIIERMYNFLEADEQYSKTKLLGASIGLSVSRARLRSLFLLCQAMLKRRLKPTKYVELEEYCLNLDSKSNIQELITHFQTVVDILDKLQLLKLDTKPVYNRHKVEEANKHHGY